MLEGVEVDLRNTNPRACFSFRVSRFEGRVRAGCTVTNCQAAVNVLEGVEVDLRNNDLSFNEVALVFDGHGSVADNVMWGNLHRSTVDVTPDALQRAQQVTPPATGAAHSPKYPKRTLSNIDLSFNAVALAFDGHGAVADNVMWGNLHRSTVDVTPDALQRAQQVNPRGWSRLQPQQP